MSQLGRVAPPQYVLQEAAGESHCPTFSILATWEHGGRGWSGLGVASSKKEAKRVAARRLLDQMFPPGDSGGGDTGDQPVTSGDTAPLTADQVAVMLHKKEHKKNTRKTACLRESRYYGFLLVEKCFDKEP